MFMHHCLMGAVSAKNLFAPGSRQVARRDCSDRAAATAALTQLWQRKLGVFSSLSDVSLCKAAST